MSDRHTAHQGGESGHGADDAKYYQDDHFGLILAMERQGVPIQQEVGREEPVSNGRGPGEPDRPDPVQPIPDPNRPDPAQPHPEPGDPTRPYPDPNRPVHPDPDPNRPDPNQPDPMRPYPEPGEPDPSRPLPGGPAQPQ